MKLVAVPMTLDECRAFISTHHRHNNARVGWRFGVGASYGTDLVGVGVLGRPVARALADGATAEVTRCCVLEAAPRGTCSFIYAALLRAWRAIGGRRLVTYTLMSESGASLRGSGARVVAELPPRKSDGWKTRLGREWQPASGQAKFRWEWEA